MKIGITELVVIFIVALLVIGPDRLPACAQKLGQAVAQFRKYSAEATKEIKTSIVEPLEEAQKPLREAVQPLEELDRAVRADVKDLKTSFRDIGKKKPAPPAETVPAGTDADNEENEENEENKEEVA